MVLPEDIAGDVGLSGVVAELSRYRPMVLKAKSLLIISTGAVVDGVEPASSITTPSMLPMMPSF